MNTDIVSKIMGVKELSEFMVKGQRVVPCPNGHWYKLKDLGFVEPYDIEGSIVAYKRAVKGGWSRLNVSERTAWVDPAIQQNISGSINFLAENGIEVTDERVMQSNVKDDWTAMELTLKKQEGVEDEL